MRIEPNEGHDGSHAWGLRSYTHAELEKIHDATLEVLRMTGVQFQSAEALDILEGGGCIVDRAGQVVKFPAWVVEEAIDSAPSQLLLAGRDERNDYALGGRRVGFTTFGAGVKTVNPETGEVTESTKVDAGNAARLADAVDQADVATTVLVARDMPGTSYDLHMLEACFANTTKHVTHIDVSGGENARRMFEMAALIAGGRDELRERPVMSILTCPTSPLMLHGSVCGIIMEGARWGVPILVLSMAMAGGTSPVTIGGTLVTHNAEVLAGIVLAQLTSKGAPNIYGSSTTMLDLVNGSAPMGAPEEGMISAAAGALAQMYRLPSWTTGNWGDSKVEDGQAAHEKTISALLPALAGVNMMYGMGALESGMAFSPTQLLIDAEIASMVRRVVQGSPIDTQSLGVDVIHRVGYGGSFLKEPHTLAFKDREQSRTSLFDRRTRGAWEKRGGITVAERAAERAVGLLATHEPEPLPSAVAEEMRAIVTSAE